MLEELSNNIETQAKRKKLTGHANWLIWLMITKSILIEKDVLDFIATRPQLE